MLVLAAPGRLVGPPRVLAWPGEKHESQAQLACWLLAALIGWSCLHVYGQHDALGSLTEQQAALYTTLL